MKEKLQQLSNNLKGELKTDSLHQLIYATDASVYRKIPLAIAYPKTEEDIVKIIAFANKQKISITPRTAGTSLAGQCVTNGIVVDVSKHFTNILEFDERNKTITVQPGIIRDELNTFLQPFGLFFGPNTSTSNRCMIGGMVGNNSSGTTSIQYGTTRDKTISLKCILSDGSLAKFYPIKENQFLQIKTEKNLEAKIYQKIDRLLSNPENQVEIKKHVAKSTIHRRNTGYAVDSLLDFKKFNGQAEELNLANLLCGSEGTLAFTTEITLQLDDLPPKYNVLIASHFKSINKSLLATQIAMKHNLHVCELMDKTILDCTKNNKKQNENRFFLQGNPKAILMLEVKADSQKDAEEQANKLIADLEKNNFGYAHIKVTGENIAKVIELRKAGLGVLGNMITDAKGVACIEDTAVDLNDLPNYIADFTTLMKKYNQQAIYYAHAGAGELHLRPVLNLKNQEDVNKFREISFEVAKLVKKYNGSLSGEHGDGLARAEFIPFMIGDKNYQLLKEIKQTFDPNNIFNKGKIIDAPKMNESLRYVPNREEPKVKTLLNFDDNNGILRLTEKCNGSGDCRNISTNYGVMCPSYRATKNEKDTTRARANALREILTINDKENKFDSKELKEVFNLCISCKACASECPSNVDVAILKAEFLHQYYQNNQPSLRDRIFANHAKNLKKASKFAGISNFIMNSYFIKRFLHIATERNLPKIKKETFSKWINNKNKNNSGKKVLVFVDEFTNYLDTEIGKDTYFVLTKLGYQMEFITHLESGRSQISKGFLNDAKHIANINLDYLKDKMVNDIPLIGIEPSAILSFRDEYLRLADDINLAKSIAKNTFTIEEFLAKEIKENNITSTLFTNENKTVKIHTHCHQKSLSSSEATFTMLNVIKNYQVQILATGCCGMAGSFGYEKEHYKLSMQIGEESVFNKLRKLDNTIEISVAGTSCRHQIKDGINRVTKHPISIFREALIIKNEK